MNFLKKNLVLIIAFVLPVALILVVTRSVYVPSMMIKTKYNFIYASCDPVSGYDYYDCNATRLSRYSVVDGKIVVSEINPTQDLNYNKIPDKDEAYYQNASIRVFLHDTENNESREITLDEAKKLTLNGLVTSPDGVTVSDNYSNGSDFYFFPFGGSSSSYGWYLTKGRGKRSLNLINDRGNYYYNGNFKFLGWVLPARN